MEYPKGGFIRLVFVFLLLFAWQKLGFADSSSVDSVLHGAARIEADAELAASPALGSGALGSTALGQSLPEHAERGESGIILPPVLPCAGVQSLALWTDQEPCAGTLSDPLQVARVELLAGSGARSKVQRDRDLSDAHGGARSAQPPVLRPMGGRTDLVDPLFVPTFVAFQVSAAEPPAESCRHHRPPARAPPTV